MNLYSTAPNTDACKIATNNLRIESWKHPQHDAHVKLFREYERVGGFEQYCAEFFRRHGYHFQIT